MRPAQPGKKILITLALAVLGALATWLSRQDGEIPRAAPADNPELPEIKDSSHAPRRTGFDFYLLALTSHPAFCADGHAREPECRAERRVPISIHGLWPERLEPGKYPRDCPGPPLDLDRGLELELEPLMPGMADGLHEHEWRKHGTCSGLVDDVYYRSTLELARRVDSALGARLVTLAGESTRAADLREYAERYEPGIGNTLTFHCKTLRNAPERGEPYLIEIRQCLEDDGADGAPGSPINCATVNRRDQGCGKSFRIAPAR